MAEMLSIAFMTCNRAAHVEQSLSSVLEQSVDGIDVVICDDASTDGTYEKLQEITANYRGGKRLHLLRNEDRLGLIGNFNRMLREGQSDYVMFAHDDDLSLPERAATVLAAIKGAAAPPSAVFHDAFNLAEDGETKGVMKYWPAAVPITPEQVAGLGASIVGAVSTYSRRVYGEFGPVPARAHFEDACSLFRAALLGNALYVPQPLIEKRIDGQSLTGPMSIGARSSGRAIRQALTNNIRNLLPTTSVWAEDLAKYAPQLDGGAERLAAIRRLLDAMEKRVHAELALLEHRPAAFKYWFAALLRRRSRPRDVAKLLLVAYWPDLWFGYARWRLRRASRSDPRKLMS